MPSRDWGPLVIWACLLALTAPLGLRLPEVVQGSSGSIEASDSGRTLKAIQERFGAGAGFMVPVIVSNRDIPFGDARFAAQLEAITQTLAAVPGVRSVAPGPVGRDGRSMLVIVQPSLATFFEVEALTPRLREALTGIAPGFSALVTGIPALFHDLNRRSSADLLAAERVGLPIALGVLLVVLRAPLAAALPLLVAVIAVTFASAAMYLAGSFVPVSAFAQNSISIIGLGVGVDYALFLIGAWRTLLANGVGASAAADRAAADTRRTVLVSGIAVAIGFAALLLVRAPFLHSIALGGVLAVGAAVAATLTLLPALLRLLGPAVNWPHAAVASHRGGVWRQWTERVTRYPGPALLGGLALVAALAAPALSMRTQSAGVADLPERAEARIGFEALSRDFESGWMGPVAILTGAPARAGAIAERLRTDPRIAQVHAITAPDGGSTLLALVTRQGPDAPETFALVRELRAAQDPALRVGGPTAMIADFDAELLGSLQRVIPAVLAGSLVVLAIAFRSVLVPLKAVIANLASVLAAYGFLVLVFQDQDAGGLNALVVLMLFTILFGLSMDYEVLMVQAVRHSGSVAAGLARSATLVTSAAAIMVALFASFGLFSTLTAARQFGVGLAFAVAFDATLIRLVIIPAAMSLLGPLNWWWPFGRRRRYFGATGA